VDFVFCQSLYQYWVIVRRYIITSDNKLGDLFTGILPIKTSNIISKVIETENGDYLFTDVLEELPLKNFVGEDY
jgi:hypothetical protein